MIPTFWSPPIRQAVKRVSVLQRSMASNTDESSFDGLGASAATVGYSMSVGPLSASIDDADIDGPGCG